MGTRAAARQPSSVDAHWMPMFWNICRENRGKLAATMERKKVFAAIAEAALNSLLEIDFSDSSKIGGSTHNIR